MHGVVIMIPMHSHMVHAGACSIQLRRAAAAAATAVGKYSTVFCQYSAVFCRFGGSGAAAVTARQLSVSAAASRHIGSRCCSQLQPCRPSTFAASESSSNSSIPRAAAVRGTERPRCSRWLCGLRYKQRGGQRGLGGGRACSRFALAAAGTPQVAMRHFLCRAMQTIMCA